MTSLNFVKINNKKITFKHGLNIITCIPKETEQNTNNNIGKTTFIHLLQAIYGQRRLHPISILLSNKIRRNKYNCNIEWEFLINRVAHNFIYNIKSSKEVIYNDEIITLDEYKRLVKKLLSNNIKVFRDTINFDYKFIRKTNDNLFISEFFSNRNQSYPAFFMLKLLFEDNTEDLAMLNVENYFNKVAKRNSYKNIRSRYHNELIEQLMETGIEDNFIKIDLLSKEARKYNKILKSEFDPSIINELRQLNLNINIDDVMKFHNSLLADYNSMMKDKLIEIENEISVLKENLSETSLSNYSQSDIDIAIEVSDFLTKIDAELRNDYTILKNDIEHVIDAANKKLNKYNEEISKTIDGDIKAKNQFSEGSFNENILQSLKFSQRLSDTTGDANKYINAMLLYALVLKESNLNIVAMDTHHTSEITMLNLNKVLLQIKSIVGKKQYLIMLFDGSIDEQMFNKDIIHYIGSGKQTLLGYSI